MEDHRRRLLEAVYEVKNSVQCMIGVDCPFHSLVISPCCSGIVCHKCADEWIAQQPGANADENHDIVCRCPNCNVEGWRLSAALRFTAMSDLVQNLDTVVSLVSMAPEIPLPGMSSTVIPLNTFRCAFPDSFDGYENKGKFYLSGNDLTRLNIFATITKEVPIFGNSDIDCELMGTELHKYIRFSMDMEKAVQEWAQFLAKHTGRPTLASSAFLPRSLQKPPSVKDQASVSCYVYDWIKPFLSNSPEVEELFG
ncbi:uncharacterized protein LOC129601104 [Paramacrobiotus metropolitanus]|uniref:uncharacterized protein LOC129601104 n=1 Tax=Paramacrobiotus metropolitanus TaxID=2943436 RepID=UPI0024457E08|nr:uncharacterized protein LOC129601104 [Paramacrobiotus metropolitanus]